MSGSDDAPTPPNPQPETDDANHAPGCSRPDPEGGYGLAGGGIGPYMYCPKCGRILSKVKIMDNAQIDHMINRFLQWKLPNPWNPDNGISFTPYGHQTTNPDVHLPIGRSLFDAKQAAEMVRFMLEGLPERRSDLAPAPPQPKGGDAQSKPITQGHMSGSNDAPGSANAQPGAQWPEELLQPWIIEAAAIAAHEARRVNMGFVDEIWQWSREPDSTKTLYREMARASLAVLAHAYAPTAPSPMDSRPALELEALAEAWATYRKTQDPFLRNPSADVILSAFPSLAARIRELEAENERQARQIEQFHLEFPATAQARIAEARDAERDANARRRQTEAHVADLEAQIATLQQTLAAVLPTILAHRPDASFDDSAAGHVERQALLSNVAAEVQSLISSVSVVAPDHAINPGPLAPPAPAR